LEGKFYLKKKVWKSKKFALIHEGKPLDIDSNLFTQELFTTCLGNYYFFLNIKIKKKVKKKKKKN
jgi:hypothetical protein